MKSFWHFVFFVFPFLAFACVYFGYVRVHIRAGLARVLVATGLAAALAKSAWFAQLGGSMFYPDFSSKYLVDAFGIAFSFAAILALLACVPPWRGRVRAILLPLVAAGLTAWGSYAALCVPRVRLLDVPVANLPPAFDGLRLAHLSDLHCSPSMRRAQIAALVARVNAAAPDLVCITGDIVDGTRAQRQDDLAPLKELRAPMGVLGCTGNHEFYSDYQAWRPVFASLGVRMLDNAHVVLTNGTDVLVVGGVSDVSGAKRGLPPDLTQAFAGAPEGGCRLLLRHRPIDLEGAARAGVSVQLSGHTHGAPLWGAQTLVAWMNDGHASGFYHEGGVTLYVTSGVGQWVGFPIRLGAPSEIVILTLRRRGGA